MAEEIINQYEEEDEIDIMAMLAKLLKKWKLIFLVTFIFSVLGVFAALKMKREYIAINMVMMTQVGSVRKLCIIKIWRKLIIQMDMQSQKHYMECLVR